MTRNKMVNGEIIALTDEEETARDTQEAQAAINKKAEQDAEIVTATKKASAKTKLKALGLTDAEIGALKI